MIRIEFQNEIILAGLNLPMSYKHDRTAELWKSFMPERKNIQGIIGTDLYSLQVYPADFFVGKNLDVVFEKWASVQVEKGAVHPDIIKEFILPAGLYVVFDYVGKAAEAATFFQFIFEEWLPKSGYFLDDRPHFEKLGERYKNDDPLSEEEIWIPVKNKS